MRASGVAFGMVALPDGAKLAWIVYCWVPITSGVCPPSSTVAVPLGANDTVTSAICASDSRLACRLASSPASGVVLFCNRNIRLLNRRRQAIDLVHVGA